MWDMQKKGGEGKMADRNYDENMEDQDVPAGSKGGKTSDERIDSKDLEEDSEPEM